MSRNQRYYLFCSLAAIILFAVTAYTFSHHQSLWVGEVTQLSGLQLSFSDIYFWLSGFLDNPFPVAVDRAPVLSYWLGSIWSNSVGSSALAVRYLSLLYVLIAMLLLVIYFHRRQQYKVLLAVLIILCFSSNLTVVAVEIRSYALLFLLSVLSVLFYIELLEAAENQKPLSKSIIRLTVVLALSINTHFFGLLLSISVITSYSILCFIDKRLVLPFKIIKQIVIIFLIAILLVLPPLIASLFAFDNGYYTIGSWWDSVTRLAYRLLAHQSMMEMVWVPIAALAIVYGVIFGYLFKRISTRSMPLAQMGIALVLLLGVIFTLLASTLLQSAHVFSVTGYIWLLPFFALFFAYIVSQYSIKIFITVNLMLVCLLGVGLYHLTFSGQKYAHTRFNDLQHYVDNYQRTSSVVVIYNQPMVNTWQAGLYRFSDDIGQYIATNEGYVNLRTKALVGQAFIESVYDVVISAYGEDIYSKQLALSSSSFSLDENSPAFQQINLSNSDWNVRVALGLMAQESAEIVIYQKASSAKLP